MKKQSLRFRGDGSFHIMVVGDIHEKNRSDPNSEDFYRLLNRSLDELQPDLAVLMGDIISSGYYEQDGTRRAANEDELRVSVQKLISPFRERSVPLALVFGNHDGEGGEPKELLFSLFSEYELFLMTDNAGVTGCGNCNVTIKASKAERDAFNLWFMDSGNRAPQGMGKYAYVRTDQIQWYEQTAQHLTAANGGTPLPAMLFQHIPVWEEYDLLKRTNRFHPYGVHGNSSRSKCVYTKNEHIIAGYLGEGPCTPDINNGQFASWKRQGDIIVAFFGHDHMNDFIGKLDNIYLIQNKCSGFHIYGDGLMQGVRELILNEETPRTFLTRMVRYREFFGTDSKSIRFEELFPDRWHTNFYAGLKAAGTAAVLGLAGFGAYTWKKHKKRGMK